MRLTEAEYEKLLARRTGSKAPDLPAEPTLPKKSGGSAKGPNKTEQAAMNALAFEFPSAIIRYEPITLRMRNGHNYTPDIGVNGPDDFSYMLVEVKNAAYRHASYGRARLAFDQCRKDYPFISWRWMEKTKEGWKIEDY